MNYNSTIKAKSYIDFFSGCGGLSLGLGWAGWNGVFAIEKDPMAYASFDRNLVAENAPHRHFPHWPEWLSREAHTIEDVLLVLLNECFGFGDGFDVFGSLGVLFVCHCNYCFF